MVTYIILEIRRRKFKVKLLNKGVMPEENLLFQRGIKGSESLSIFIN